MAVFTYTATDRSRSVVRGAVAADSPRQARELLRSRGLFVQAMEAHQEAAAPGGLRLFQPRPNAGKLTQTIRELATLLGVGVTVADALETVVKQQQGRYRQALMLLKDRISAGSGLAEAMAEQPEVFDPLTVNMVEVGENSGTLDTVLDQLAAFKERSLELKDRVVTALLYPAFVLLVTLAVTIFLMTCVVPSLIENLLEAGQVLPWPTRIVKTLSDVLVDHGGKMALGAAAVVAGLIAAYRTHKGKRLGHRLLLSTPVIGPLARKQAVARMALVTSTLIKSGVTFLRAVEIAVRTMDNVVLRDALADAAREVGAGSDIGPALERTGAFPPLVVQVFAVGQQSGRLEDMLDRLATDYDRQTATLAGRLAVVVEPILILLLAVLVGFILIATVLPILEAGNAL